MRIPLSNVNLSELEEYYVLDAVRTGWISGTGNYVTKFEDALAEKVDRRYAIAVSNGTVALELALLALGIGPGDEVICPALTFAAPVAMVKKIGAKPVLVDIDPISWTLDIDEVQAALSRRTQAIIAVDLLGHPANYWALEHAAPGIPIIEDAAQAHGAIYNSKPVGSLGHISTFSFMANKPVTCGEGGAVLTDDYDLAQRLRLIANHGMTSVKPYWHEVVGSNYRMTNLQAAIGLGQVQRWDELVKARKIVAEEYNRLLQVRLFDINFRPVEDYAYESTWLYVLRHSERERIINHLRSTGIDARPIWTAIPDNPAYQSSLPFPVARRIANEAFWLPTWAGMPEGAIKEVADAVLEVIAETVTA